MAPVYLLALLSFLKKEKQLLDKLQDTREFSLQDRERICPRFIFLGEKDSVAWVTLKEALATKKTVCSHFLCEARYDDYRHHAVKDQEGLDLSELKDWAKKIGPWLKVSLASIFTSICQSCCKCTVVFPGVGMILRNSPEWKQASLLSDEIAQLSQKKKKMHIMDGMGLDANYTHQNLRALNGKSRKALIEFSGKLSLDEYKQKLSLRKVRLSHDDGSHGVLWICRECFEKYASMKPVSELPI